MLIKSLTTVPPEERGSNQEKYVALEENDITMLPDDDKSYRQHADEPRRDD